MEKFNDLIAALSRNARITVGVNTFNGTADIAKFRAKYENDLDYLRFSQTRVYEASVRYVTKSRIGAN